MATCSIILAWKIPWAEEPGGLQSMGHTRIGTHTHSLTLTRTIQSIGTYTQTPTPTGWILGLRSEHLSAR